MKRSLSLAFAACAASLLALPATALSTEITIANTGTVSPPSCPASPCAVVSRTTAVQVKDGSDIGPFTVSRRGRIVSWSVTLADPSALQIHYFDLHEGGTARAALAVLHNKGGLDFKLVALSPLEHLQPDFGKTTQFQLATPIHVAKGDVLALSVPTWIPALALGYQSTTSWRASRSTSQCLDVTIQTFQTVIGSSAAYDCLYQTALITYSATESTG
jgi:hypothetical protein